MNIQFKCLPIDGPLRITSGYGPRQTGIEGASAYHRGNDMGCDKSKYKGTRDGGPVYAVLPGTVAESYWNNSRGWVVLIDHGFAEGKNIKTLYQHLRAKGLPQGARAAAGDMVGRMGNTGIGAQLHLHFELRLDNRCADPEPYLRRAPRKAEKEEIDMNREDMIALIDRRIEEKLEGEHTEMPGWAAANGSWEEGKKAGVTDGSRPGGFATRAEVNQIVLNAMKHK